MDFLFSVVDLSACAIRHVEEGDANVAPRRAFLQKTVQRKKELTNQDGEKAVVRVLMIFRFVASPTGS